MIILRHNKLQQPYDNYSNLNIKELDDLALSKINPSIQNIAKEDLDTQSIDYIKKANYFLCSESNRTFETAKGISFILNLSKEIKFDANLNEIKFHPSKILPGLSQKDILKQIRVMLYKHIELGGYFAEGKIILKNRLDAVLKFKNYNIVCISHGFFIRLLKAYIKSNYNIDRAFDIVQEISPVNFLEIYKI